MFKNFLKKEDLIKEFSSKLIPVSGGVEILNSLGEYFLRFLEQPF